MDQCSQRQSRKDARLDAAAVRRGDHHQATDVRLRLEEQRFFQAGLGLWRRSHFIERLVEIGAPERVAAIHHAHLADQPAHTVTDQDHLLQGRIVTAGIEEFERFTERPAQVGGRGRQRQPGRIEE